MSAGFDHSELDIRADLVSAPDLSADMPVTSFFEFWPGWMFYAPVVLMIAALAVKNRSLTAPSAANPYFEVGGLTGESKSQILSLLPASMGDIVPKWTVLRRGQHVEETRLKALSHMKAAGLEFPVVAKPDIGCRGAGVVRLTNTADMDRYIAAFPMAERIVLQELCDLPMEAGVFYARRPDEDRGRIVSLTLKYFPFVVGDGVRCLRDLILDDPRAGKLAHMYLPRHAAQWNDVIPAGERRRIAFAGNHAKGAMFRDGHDDITPAMAESWDRIARQIPEFYFGRIDVRCSSIADLETGTNVKIVEVNGAGSEMTHIWDPRTRLVDAYKSLWSQWSLAYEIGSDNRRRGHRADSLLHLVGLWAKEQALVRLYPASE